MTDLQWVVFLQLTSRMWNIADAEGYKQNKQAAKGYNDQSRVGKQGYLFHRIEFFLFYIDV